MNFILPISVLDSYVFIYYPIYLNIHDSHTYFRCELLFFI